MTFTATGQSFSVGEIVNLMDFSDAMIKYPEEIARDRRVIATIDLDAEYARLDSESKARLKRNGLQSQETLQTDGWTGKDVSVNLALYCLNHLAYTCLRALHEDKWLLHFSF